MTDISETLDDRKPAGWLSIAKLSVGSLLSLALLFFIFRGMDRVAFVEALKTIAPHYVVLGLALLYLSIPLRALQWWWLLGNKGPLNFPVTAKAIFLGHLSNLILPLRGGEFVRTIYLSKATSIPVERVLVSVVLTRLQDCLPIMIVVALTTGIIQTDTPFLQTGLSLLILFAAIGALFIVALSKARRYISSIAVNLVGRFSQGATRWVQERLLQLNDALSILGQHKLFWGSQFLALICWFIFAISAVPLLLGMGIALGDAIKTAFIITGITALVQIVPSAPAGIGTFHAACLFALSVTQPTLAPESAMAFTVVLHLIGTLGLSLPGLLFLPTLLSITSKNALTENDSRNNFPESL